MRIADALIYEGSDDGFSNQAFAAYVRVFGCEHGGSNALSTGRSLLGWTPREGSDRGRWRGGKHHDDCASADPDAWRWNNHIDRPRRGKKGSTTRRAGVQSIFRHVDLDCVWPRCCRIPSAPGLL